MREGLLVVKGTSRLTRLDWIHLSRSRNRLYTGLCPDLNEVIYLHWRNTLPSQRIPKNDYELPITNFLQPNSHKQQDATWAGSRRPPTPPKPPTAAASLPTDPRANDAGKAVTASSPAWTRTISWMLLRMTRRHGGNAGKRLRSLRGLVRRLGYVALEELRLLVRGFMADLVYR